MATFLTRERISRTHSSSEGTIHTDFVIACCIVSSLPLMIIVILVPSCVYINMGKARVYLTLFF